MINLSEGAWCRSKKACSIPQKKVCLKYSHPRRRQERKDSRLLHQYSPKPLPRGRGATGARFPPGM